MTLLIEHDIQSVPFIKPWIVQHLGLSKHSRGPTLDVIDRIQGLSLVWERFHIGGDR